MATKTTYTLVVEVTRSTYSRDRFQNVRARVESSEGLPWYDPKHGLYVTGQQGGLEAGPFYAWETSFSTTEGNLKWMTERLPVLKQVDRHLNRLADRFGPCKDFAEYVLRVADALGVEYFSLKGSTLSMSGPQMADHLREQEREFAATFTA